MALTINKWGNSSAVRLPKQLLKELDLKVNDQLRYEVKGKQIILEKVDSHPELTVEELFKDYNGEPVSVHPYLFESRGEEQW